jgi:CspA family cold shock protein
MTRTSRIFDAPLTNLLELVYTNAAISRNIESFWRFRAPFSFSLALLAPGPVGPHEKESEMPIGTVKFFNSAKGYGFIQPDDGGNDAFVHVTAVERAGLTGLNENQRLSYDLQQDRPGKMSAVNLQQVDGATENAQPEQSDEQQRTGELDRTDAEQDPEQVL